VEIIFNFGLQQFHIQLYFFIVYNFIQMFLSLINIIYS